MNDARKTIYKPKPVSGFPEWLPELRLVEQQWFDHIRKVFESYGFCSVETPSVEELDVLRAKGEVDKEIYVIERLHRDDGDKDEARLALHFDQTVPLARYVAQHFNDLVFPFKRYQMQRVWRGERPQAGRFREFYQCDIDVIGIDALPLHFDAEMPAIMWEVLNGLPGMGRERIQIRISNRKILYKFLKDYNIERVDDIIRAIDKMEKVGREQTRKAIEAAAGDFADDIVKLAQIKAGTAQEFRRKIEDIGTEGRTLLQDSGGVDDLCTVLQNLEHLPEGAVVADLSIVRGLDYYTGTVYETVFVDDPGYGSICSGGRYDDLAGSYINKNLPGVGISIGFSRLFDRLRQQGAFDTTRKSPADILMVLWSEEHRADAARTATALRRRGLNVEMFHAPKKFPDQLKYASRKGIPYVWLPPSEPGRGHEVKDMGRGTQSPADPETWTPERKEPAHAAVA